MMTDQKGSNRGLLPPGDTSIITETNEITANISTAVHDTCGDDGGPHGITSDSILFLQEALDDSA